MVILNVQTIIILQGNPYILLVVLHVRIINISRAQLTYVMLKIWEWTKNVVKAKASILLFTCSFVPCSGRPAVAKVLFYLERN